MYQLNLSKEEYELLEEMICKSFKRLVVKKQIADLTGMLKEAVPVNHEISDELDSAVNDFNRKYQLWDAIHERLHGLNPIVELKKPESVSGEINRADENNHPSLTDNLNPIPSIVDLSNGNVFMPIDASKERIGKLYPADKRLLTVVFSMITAYRELVPSTTPGDLIDDKLSEIKEARDFIWGLIDSIK